MRDGANAYLRIINFTRTKQSVQRIVSWDEKASKVYEKLSSNIEEYEEEIDSDETEEGIDFWHGCLFLKPIEGRILGKLFGIYVSEVSDSRLPCTAITELQILVARIQIVWMEMNEAAQTSLSI